MIFQDHVHKQFLEQGVASCKRLCDEFIRPSLGPNGAFKMIQVPGGRLTISASIQKILHAIQKQQEEQDRLNLHPVARLLMKAAENHSNKYVGDSCGLYIIFTTTLLELLVKSNGNDFRVQQINRSLSQFLHTILPNKIVPHLFENVRCF
jgi:chaperonin GroEL (HSP60 family)